MKGDRGSVTGIVLAMVALVAFAGVGSTSIGGLLAAREQAYSAAEAAALAAAVATYPPTGANDPRGIASEYAALNGTTLFECQCAVDGSLSDRTVTVGTVVRRSVPLFGEVAVKAKASAEFSPRAWLGR